MQKALQRVASNNARLPLMQFTRRFEGGYPWFDSLSQKMPSDRGLKADEYLDDTEVHTRMNYVLNNFKIFDLEKISYESSFEELGLDSLDQTALLTSMEHEFHVVFEDRLFENFKTLGEVRRFIGSDHNCF